MASKWIKLTLAEARAFAKGSGTIRVKTKQHSVIAGVYAVYFDGRLMYVGSTTNMRKRIRWHVAQPRALRADGEWMVKYRPSRYFADWLTLEARLIRRLKPALNIEWL